MTKARVNPLLTLEERVYLLRDRDGDYVSVVRSTGYETTKVFFEFTRDKHEAKQFSYTDLYSRLAISPVGIEFSKGFPGGTLERIR